MRGAAPVAPTAPHGTPPEGGAGGRGAKKTGPEKFWDLRRVRIAMAVCVVLSLGIHWWIGPWTVRSGLKFEVHDTEGDIAIPVDLIEEEAPPPPAPAPPPPTTTSDKPEEGPNARDAGPPPRKDAGPKDAAPRDVEVADADTDGAIKDAEPRDAGEADGGLLAFDLDAAATGGEGGALAQTDGGGGGLGPRDPEGLVGGLGKMQAGENLVTLFINVEVIRKHPTGPKLSKLVRAAPQWDDALKGTTVDPVRDADWVLIFGPALLHTEKDTILVHYSVPDAVADEAIEAIKRRSHNGAGYDAGVPGVKATLGHADRAPRVFLRGKSKTIAVVPPSFASTAARMLLSEKAPAHPRPGEAMRLTVKNPSRPIPQLPARITELRLWIIPQPDGGADVFAELQNPDGQGAMDSENELKSFLSRYRGSMEGALANMVSRGLINGIEVSSALTVTRLHVRANAEQIDAIIGFVAAQAGIDLTAPPPAPPR
jgi:hypothetical protein